MCNGIRRNIAMIAIVVFCFLVVACAESPALISGHPDWWPFMYKNGNAIDGIGVDVTKMVLDELNISANSSYVGSWDQVQEKAKNGEIDVIVALYKTKEREKYLTFSIPYANDPVVVFVKSYNKSDYDGKEDLIYKKGVAMVGDSYGQNLDDFILQKNLCLTRVLTPKEAFELVDKNKADYFLYSLWAGKKVINQEHLVGMINSTVLSNQPFYIGFSKKSRYVKYMDTINQTLQELIDNGTISKMVAAS